MDYLPIFMRIQGQKALVVGGGQVATRKIAMLLRAGANIRLVAQDVGLPLAEMLQDGDHEIFQRGYEKTDLDGVKLVIAATDDEQVNHQVYKHASKLNLPVNVVDNPSHCDFIFPSIVDRSPVVVAVSSSGHSPMLARLLRSRLETFIPSGYGKLASLLGEYREKVKQSIPLMSQRMRFWEKILGGPVAEQMVAGKDLVM